ncbi:hypothetical protein ILUMI_16883 [Ignelater luminosus]|uniref:Uncharacterized protein n=1 Tax=Ignelater luminosus TaxID=2038154 RepID=A0A8K0G2F2_IGNLU|nr:hypothetical protein ILUMI_16883 [Ignelater luminosus]
MRDHQKMRGLSNYVSYIRELPPTILQSIETFVNFFGKTPKPDCTNMQNFLFPLQHRYYIVISHNRTIITVIYTLFKNVIIFFCFLEVKQRLHMGIRNTNTLSVLYCKSKEEHKSGLEFCRTSIFKKDVMLIILGDEDLKKGCFDVGRRLIGSPLLYDK